MRAFAIVATVVTLLAGAAPAAAQFAAGLSFTEITPADFANSTVLSLAFDPDGNLFASDGQFLSSVPLDGSPSASEPLLPPIPVNQVATDITFDTSGNLYIADFASARILARPPGGQAFTVFATGLLTPRRMAFDLAGDLLVMGGNGSIGDTGYVKRVDRLGRIEVIAPAIAGPVAIAVNSSNEVFVLTHLGDVVKISLNGEPLLFSALPPAPENATGTFGTSLAINAEDELFIGVNRPGRRPVTGNNGSLYRIALSGDIFLIGTHIGDGVQVDIVFSPDGELFAANHKAQVPEETVLRISGVPAQRADCKNGAWVNFFNPSFKNQGRCVSYVNHEPKHR